MIIRFIFIQVMASAKSVDPKHPHISETWGWVCYGLGIYVCHRYCLNS